MIIIRFEWRHIRQRAGGRFKSASGKNAITLFDTGAEYIYDWETFQTGILAEKLSTMETFFVDFEQERGNAFYIR